MTIKKLDLGSKDLVRSDIEKLAEIFPDVITEEMDEAGDIKKSIDFEKFKAIFSADIISEGKERYEFTWPGKRAAMAEANAPINKTLRPVMEESKNWDETENLYIEGDNLEVLKLLQESYLGKVKMIYIDPPYNTGKDFVYDDDYRVDLDTHKERSDDYDEENNKLRRNPDTNELFHSDWCSMIYPRLRLARNLLSDDAVIFISIDDNEQENLKKICDEVFGASEFIATIVRNTNSSKNQSKFISVSHEYCHVYSKDKISLTESLGDSKWEVLKNNIKEYENKVNFLKNENLSKEEITEELKELTKYPRFIDFTNYWYFDEKGLYQKDNLGGIKNGNKNPIINPLTNQEDPIPPGGFRYSNEKLQELIKDNRIHFHTDGSLPRIKRYLSENRSQRPKSIMSDDQRPDNNLMAEFNTPFDNPKQLTFMKRLVSIFDKDSFILDFFSGSATTAHAVMDLNAEDGGNRKFIMVNLPEETDENSEAYKAGYKNICEIGKERIRRAGEKILADNKDKEGIEKLDTGFRVLRVDSTNMKDVYYSPNNLEQNFLYELESNIKEDRTELDLLFSCLLAWGLPLDKKYRSERIGSYTIHLYNEKDLVACFSDRVSEDIIKHIAKIKPSRVVFRDSCFASSEDKINVEEIFKNFSPETDIRVL